MDEQRYNPAESLADFKAAMGFAYRYKDISFKQLTPATWCFLFCIESPFVKETKREVHEADVDLFFYIVNNGIEDEDIVELAKKSFGWCKEHNLSVDDALYVIKQLTSAAFSPLKMFPVTNSEGKQISLFDADWLTSLCAKVHEVTGYSPEYIMNNMSLNACCFYYIQYARHQGVKNIERASDEEILIAQDRRSCEMICDRLVELGVIKEEERADLFKKISTPPAK